MARTSTNVWISSNASSNDSSLNDKDKNEEQSCQCSSCKDCKFFECCKAMRACCAFNE